MESAVQYFLLMVEASAEKPPDTALVTIMVKSVLIDLTQTHTEHCMKQPKLRTTNEAQLKTSENCTVK